MVVSRPSHRSGMGCAMSAEAPADDCGEPGATAVASGPASVPAWRGAVTVGAIFTLAVVMPIEDVERCSVASTRDPRVVQSAEDASPLSARVRGGWIKPTQHPEQEPFGATSDCGTAEGESDQSDDGKGGNCRSSPVGKGTDGRRSWQTAMPKTRTVGDKTRLIGWSEEAMLVAVCPITFTSSSTQASHPPLARPVRNSIEIGLASGKMRDSRFWPSLPTPESELLCQLRRACQARPKKGVEEATHTHPHP